MPRPSAPVARDYAEKDDLCAADGDDSEEEIDDTLDSETLYWHHEVFSSLQTSLTRIYYRTACLLLEPRPRVVHQVALELSQSLDEPARHKIKRRFSKFMANKIRIVRGDDILEEILDLKQRLEADYVGPKWMVVEAAREVARLCQLAKDEDTFLGRHRQYRQGPSVIRAPRIETIFESPEEEEEEEEEEEGCDNEDACGASIILYIEPEGSRDHEHFGPDMKARFRRAFDACASKLPTVDSSGGSEAHGNFEQMRISGTLYTGDLPPETADPWDVEEKGSWGRCVGRVKELFCKRRPVSPF